MYIYLFIYIRMHIMSANEINATKHDVEKTDAKEFNLHNYY